MDRDDSGESEATVIVDGDNAQDGGGDMVIVTVKDGGGGAIILS